MAQQDYYGTTRRRSWLWTILIPLIPFLLGIGAAALAFHHWGNIAKLLHPVAETQPVSPPPAPTRVVAPMLVPPNDPAINERVATLESRVDAIDARAAEASGDADRAEGLLVAFAARRALDRGQPLGFLEGMLRERFGGTDATSVAQIIAASQRPVTLAQLRDGLETLRPALLTQGTNEGWWQGFKHEISGLFVIRRTNQLSIVPTDRLARAEHALETGQVDNAATEVARMPGAPNANEWLAKARRYTLARNALDRIETAALLMPRATPDPVVPPAG
ncbi:MAG TPA: hypothetical protein VNT42_09765 [Sphingomonas sp.]|nr:hypothetical protein [Sphingomonas sp.]